MRVKHTLERAPDTSPDPELQPHTGDMPTVYADMTVPELRHELEERDLPVSGRKKTLIKRLEADDE